MASSDTASTLDVNLSTRTNAQWRNGKEKPKGWRMIKVLVCFMAYVKVWSYSVEMFVQTGRREINTRNRINTQGISFKKHDVL